MSHNKNRLLGLSTDNKVSVKIYAFLLVFFIFATLLNMNVLADTPITIDKHTEVSITSGIFHYSVIIKNNFNYSINASWNITIRRIPFDKDFIQMEQGFFIVPGLHAFEKIFYGFGLLSVINVNVSVEETKEQYDFKGYQILGVVIFL